MEGSAHTNALKNALICFEDITYVPLRGLQIPADAWLTLLLFKAFRYSVISLVARLKMFYSRLYMMRVLFYLQITGTCTKLAGRVAAGQIKECTRLPMQVAELAFPRVRGGPNNRALLVIFTGAIACR